MCLQYTGSMYSPPPEPPGRLLFFLQNFWAYVTSRSLTNKVTGLKCGWFDVIFHVPAFNELEQCRVVTRAGERCLDGLTMEVWILRRFEQIQKVVVMCYGSIRGQSTAVLPFVCPSLSHAFSFSLKRSSSKLIPSLRGDGVVVDNKQ